MFPTFWQADPKWNKEIIGVDARMGGSGCVVTTETILILLLKGRHDLNPLDVLKVLRQTPGVFVDANGKEPGNLLVWSKALAPFGLKCDEAVASVPDHESTTYEFAGHMVDANANLAGALAGAMETGAAAVRVDTDGDGQGNHTIACVGRDGDKFLCSDPALNAIITLDENLENADIHWGSKPHPYRATGIRAIRAVE